MRRAETGSPAEDRCARQWCGRPALLSGAYAQDCGERARSFSLLAHPAYVNALFGTLWKELGGTYAGTVRDETMDPGARLIATAKSPSLSEVVRDINKYSNNVMARQLFLTLGGVAGGAPRLWRRRATPSRPGLRRNS